MAIIELLRSLFERLFSQKPGASVKVEASTVQWPPKTTRTICNRLSLREPRPELNAKSLVLQLPAEITLEIFDWLPLQDRYIVSQTCQLWRILALREGPLDLDQLGRWDQFKLFRRVAKNDLNNIVCTDCHRLHHIQEGPGGMRNLMVGPCPRSFANNGSFRSCTLDPWRRLGDFQFLLGNLQDYHVQTALKLFDMDSSPEKLKALLATTHTPSSGMVMDRVIDSTLMPKIIDGRFLLCAQRTITRQCIGKQNEWLSAEFGLCDLLYNVRSIWGDSDEGHCGPSTLEFRHVLTLAFETRGRSFTGSCLRCWYDYSIVVHAADNYGPYPQYYPARVPVALEVTCWLDFGIYDAPVRIYDDWDFFDGFSEPKHQPGSIRELWGTTE